MLPFNLPGLIVVFVGIVAFVGLIWVFDVEEGHRTSIGALLLSIGVVLIALVLFGLLVHNVRAMSGFLLATLGRFTFLVMGSSVAGFLYLLRGYRKDLYGLLEMAVAAATLTIIGDIRLAPDALAAAIGFIGAVYVMVRGMTNYVEGRGESGLRASGAPANSQS